MPDHAPVADAAGVPLPVDPAAEHVACLHAFAAARGWLPGVGALLSRIQSQLGAYRVSLAWRRGGSMNLVAWSDVVPLDEGVGVDDLESACDEALQATRAVCWPPLTGAGAGADAASEVRASGWPAHEALFRSQGLIALMSVPLRDDQGLVQGVIVCERIPMLNEQARRGPLVEGDTHGFASPDREWLEQLAILMGPVLSMRHRLEQPWYLRSWSWLAWGVHRLGDPRERLLRGVVLACFGIGAFLFGWPMPYTIAVPARLEAQSLTAVVAPADAVIERDDVHVGQVLRAGQPLGRLSGTQDEGSVVMAPFDGVLIQEAAGGHAGAQVRRGDTLWLVAPGLDWRVVLEVDEADVAGLSPGQHAVLRLASAPGRDVHLLISKAVPVAIDGDHHLRFEMEAQVSGGASAGLRPGLRGMAYIDMPSKPLLQRAIDGVRNWWWLTMWGLW